MPKIVNGVIQTGDNDDNDGGSTSNRFGVCFGNEISWTTFGIFMFVCGIFGGMPGLLMGGLVAIACRISSSRSNGTDSNSSNNNRSGGANIRSIGDYPKPVKC